MTPAPPRPLPTRSAPLNPVLRDFEELQPLPQYADEEQEGDFYHSGPPMDYIESESLAAGPQLPDVVQRMIQATWKKASMPNGRQAGPTIGSAVNARMQGFLPQPAPYVKQVAPLRVFDSQFKNAQKATTEGRQNPNWGALKQGPDSHFPRVNAYTFRGDSRLPEDILAAGGFFPPITRNDTFYINNTIYPQFSDYMKRRFGKDVDISLADFLRAYNQTVHDDADRHLLRSYLSWRGLLEAEAFHVGIMLAQEDLKGYISTTRAISVAKAFSYGKGAVYVTRINGGFLVPDKGKHIWTQLFGEQEIAFPGSIPWSEIFAFRKTYKPTGNVKFNGPVYIRRTLRSNNPKAFKTIYDLLSGKDQVGREQARRIHG